LQPDFYATLGLSRDFLYKTDGQKVARVGDIYDVEIITSFGEDLYLTGWTGGTPLDGGTSALYKTDGSELTLLRELTTDRHSPQIANLFEHDGNLLFSAYTDQSGFMLFKTDGVKVTEIDSPIPISNIVDLEGDLYYVVAGMSSTDNSIASVGIYKYDGWRATPIYELESVGDSSFFHSQSLVEFNGSLYFLPTIHGDDSHLVKGLYRLTIVPEPSGLLSIPLT